MVCPLVYHPYPNCKCGSPKRGTGSVDDRYGRGDSHCRRWLLPFLGRQHGADGSGGRWGPVERR